ncbi:MAG: pentapeptide repeat-containing protein [Planctomycetota bacterium]|nr:pentapeptide repeat-containing protein [Planctomycetota bacterium]
MEAELMATQLTRAILDGADLRGTDLRGCQGLTADQLQGVKLDHRTRLPRALQYLISTRPHVSCQSSPSCSAGTTH